MSDSLQPHGLQPTRLLRSWDSPAKNTGVGCHFLLHRIFPTQGSSISYVSCVGRRVLYHERHQIILRTSPWTKASKFFHVNLPNHFGASTNINPTDHIVQKQKEAIRSVLKNGVSILDLTVLRCTTFKGRTLPHCSENNYISAPKFHPPARQFHLNITAPFAPNQWS